MQEQAELGQKHQKMESPLTVVSGLRISLPNNDTGAEMGCTTPDAVGAGAMRHSLVAAAGCHPGRRRGDCPSQFDGRIN